MGFAVTPVFWKCVTEVVIVHKTSVVGLTAVLIAVLI